MSFLEGPKTIGSIKLRPFSFGTLEACERMNLTLFTSPSGADGLSASEVRRQIVSFAWVQSQAPEVVVEAMTNGTHEKAVALFQFGLGVDCVNELVAEVQRIAEAVKAVSVDVVQKPGSGRHEDTPPPN